MTGLRDYLRETPVYTLYCKHWLKRDVGSEIYDFYRRITGDLHIPQELWFDVGANIGQRSTVFSKLAQHVVALEPDPNNALSLRRRFRFRKGITILELAVGAHSGRETMLTGYGPYSTLAPRQRELNEQMPQDFELKNGDIQTREVSVISLDELIARYGLPGYIKVDVEGYEEVVFSGLSQKVPLISFEANLPDFEQETIGCIAHLARISAEAQFNYIIAEPPDVFASESWLAHDEMTEIVKSKSHHYMEIFARSA